MRRALLVFPVALLLAAPAVASHEPEISMSLTLFANELPSIRECRSIIVPGWNTMDVLVNLTQQGCIMSWHYESPGDNVDCINELCAAMGWQLYVNETRKSGTWFLHHFYGEERVEFVHRDNTRVNP